MPSIDIEGQAPPILRTTGLLKRLCSPAHSVLIALSLTTPAWGQAPPPAPPLAPPRPELPALPPTPTNQPSIQAAFSVLIDAAHGGADSGARIASQLLEKDLTLGFSVRLRSALAARGITVLTTRESDIVLPANQRAGIANHTLASACLLIHATATGSGIHLFTSSLPPASVPSAAVLPWQTAQSGWITRSLRLSSEINSALGQAGIPVTLGRAAVRPLDNLTCPAVAIEIAPLAASPANQALPISDPKYQQRILDALAAALLEWSTDWRQQP